MSATGSRENLSSSTASGTQIRSVGHSIALEDGTGIGFVSVVLHQSRLLVSPTPSEKCVSLSVIIERVKCYPCDVR